MFEQKILFNKLFSGSKIVGAIKDKLKGHFCHLSHFWLFFAILKWHRQSIQRQEEPYNYPNFYT